MDYTNKEQFLSFIESIKNKIINDDNLSNNDIENWNNAAVFLIENSESKSVELKTEKSNDGLNNPSELPDEIILPTYSSNDADVKEVISENNDIVEKRIESEEEQSQNDFTDSTRSESTNWSDLLDEEDDVLEEALSGIDLLEGNNTIDLSEELTIQENEQDNLKSPLLSNMDLDDENEEEPMIRNISYNLPNGMVGKFYTVHLNDSELVELPYSGFLGLEEIGLEYDPDQNIISGTPNKVGDMELEVLFDEKDPYENHTIRLFINPDPKSLWKSIDPPKDGKFYKTNADSSSILTQGYKIIAGSTRGRSHAHEGKFRDDDFEIRAFENGWKFLAVADGAGSAQYSREGSRITVTRAAEVAHEQISEHREELNRLLLLDHKDEVNDDSPIKKLVFSIVKNIVEDCRTTLKEACQSNDCKLSDFNTTLIFTIMKPLTNGFFIASYAIGDGAAVIYNHKKNIFSLMEGDGGEYAGQTRFITMEEVASPADIFDRVRCCFIDDFTSILLMTDGVSDPKFQSDADLMDIGVWDNLYSDLTAEVHLYETDADKNLTSWLDFFSRGNHDDRTMAMLYKNKT